MDLQLAEKKIIESLTSEFDGLPFTPNRFKNGGTNMLEVTSEAVNLHGVYDNIFLSFGVSEHGICFFSMIFDKLAVNEPNLKLVNEINQSETHFKAYINKNGYFVLESTQVANTEDDFANLGIQFMRRGGYLGQDENVKALVQFLVKEQ